MNTKNWRFFGVCLFYLFALLYLKSLVPGIYWDDSGELIASAATLGVPHPTGYPLYALLARLFSLLPLGAIAWRVNLLSVFCAAGTVYLVWLTADRYLLAKSPELAAIPALFLGFSPVLWHSGSIAEVYSLNLLLIALMFFLYFRPETQSGLKLFLFCAALSLGNHLTLVLFIPALIFFFADRRRLKFLLTRGLPVIILLGGLYLYLPLRAAANPPLNWGEPYQWNNFVWLVSGAEFSARMFKGGLGALAGRLGKTLLLFANQFQLGLVLGLIGMVVVFFRDRRRGIFLHLAFWGVALFTLGYDITPLSDWRAYFLPAWLVFSFFIAETLAYFPSSKTGALMLLALPLVMTNLNPCFNLHRNDYAPSRDARFIINLLQPDALVINHDSTRTFSLLYLKYIEGRKTGLDLIYAPLLNYDWYVDRQKRKGISFPSAPRKSVKYSSYLGQIAYLNLRDRSVYGFDWWTENFPNLLPQGPLFQIRQEEFEARNIPRIRQLEKAYYDYLTTPGEELSLQLKQILSEHYAALGSFFQRHSLFREAVPLYRRSLKFNARQIVLRNNLAISLEESGLYEQAIDEYLTTIRLRPDYTSAYGNLGQLYYKTGQRAQAIQIITRALETNPRGAYTSELRNDLYKIQRGEPLR